MKPDLAIDGTFYIDGMLVRTSVGIKDGIIISVRKGIDASERVSFDNSIILPGAVDLHVHFREPGLTQKEDITSGSISAAFGGVTCVGEMPNTVPPATTPDRVERKIELFRSKSYVDFIIYAGLMEGVRIGPLSSVAAAFKMYMGSTTGDLLCDDPDVQWDLIRRSAEAGKVVIVHAEEESRRNRISERNLRDHYRARPPACEIEAVRRLAVYSEREPKPRIHVAHTTVREAVDLNHPQNMTFEVTPHHLLLDYDMHLGSRGKVNPPLRRREDRTSLLRLLESGMIQTVGSDHSPHTLEEKGDEFDYAPSGLPGVETLLPLLLNMVANEELSMQAFVRAACEKPAQLLGLRKGRIAAGYDADFAVVNMKKSVQINADKLHYKCRWSPFEGMYGIFPDSVFLRGEEVIRNGALVGKPRGRNASA
ncbi:MAG: dihydroorotase [Thermoplasmata archaeon]|uniref:Dihydroorotase n=1 Tax=Candidatus Sysuiplasma superficiale TaxID=2823368 RepID=A0A8J7YUV5_9ARCH|nr:dihydroorotase [Candidatus Sysuiplasma superficiale]MBX8644932.1 dihydroorotase [Candidatus Sysuiplasma superficiale]MCL4347166.1 dihydroorotase [Candidatus Thermoplasmatota archaeon]